jgi:hypothetical protein
VDLGGALDRAFKTSALQGHRAANRGVVVIDEQGVLIYKYISTDAKGRPSPSGKLPDVAAVLQAVLSRAARSKL